MNCRRIFIEYMCVGMQVEESLGSIYLYLDSVKFMNKIIVLDNSILYL